jgi:hypothetical protein
MLRRGLFVLAAAGVLAAPAAAPAAAPRDSIGIRVLGRGPYLVLSLKPGTTAIRQVAVSSTLSRPVEVPLLAVTARTTADGYQILDQKPDWLDVQPSTLRLDTAPPGEVIEEAATVTITVPADARPTQRLEAAVLAVAPPSEGGNVRMINRVGVRVYLTIAGRTVPWLQLCIALFVLLGGGSWALSKLRKSHRKAGWSPVHQTRLRLRT